MLPRLAKPSDAPNIYALLEDNQNKLFDDYSTVDKRALMAAIAAQKFIVIDDSSGNCVGLVSILKQEDDLFISLSAAFSPCALKAGLAGFFSSLIGFLFDYYKVGKIEAMAMDNHKQAIKLLNRYKFKQSGLLRNHTKLNGKLRDVFIFELHAKYWRRHIESK